MGRIPTDDELLAQITLVNAETGPDAGLRAVAVRYDRRTRRVEVELADGCLFAFPADRAQGLAGASDEALAEVSLSPEGKGLHWEGLDADLSVAGLLAGMLGSRTWMSAHARALGRSRSEAKAAAARANGKKGGRPRKRSAP